MDETALRALIEDLRQLGADHGQVEAKRARGGVPRELWRSIVAFANKRGGAVLLGVDERSGFTVTGVDDPAATEARLGQLCSMEIEPPVRAQITSHQVEGRWVVVAEIPAVDPVQRPAYFRSKGLPVGAYIRVGDGDRQMSAYEVHLLLSHRSRPREELQPVTEATLDDLDTDAVDAYVKRMRSTRPRAFTERDDETLLRMNKILVDADGALVPSLAGLLAFGIFPQQFYPQVNLTFVAYPDVRRGVPGPGGERFLDTAACDGPVPEMVEAALRRLRSNMRRAAVIKDIGRTDVWEYPLAALREAIVNALVHRDFSAGALGAQVQVELFPDRVAIGNPGGLYGAVDPSQLLTTPVSATRNPVLLRILEDVPMAEGGMVCENRGSGLAVIAESLRQQGNPAPEFADSLAVFEVTFRAAKTEPAAPPKPVPSPEGPPTDTATEQILSELQQGPRSRRELTEQTGLASHVIRYRLEKLRDTGAVRQVGRPRDPRGKWQLS